MKRTVITTSKYSGERLAVKQLSNKRDDSSVKSDVQVRVDVNARFQKFIGFGGAFTEAGSTTLDKLSGQLRQEAIDAYFHPDRGINYTFCRTHIQSCDFSLGNYSYIEDPEDVTLKSFTIERDKQSLIPLIKDALKTSNKGFKLFASPWSPPPFMKTNGRMNNGGSLKREYYKMWADCFVKYIEEYKKEGIELWAVSIQNEPQAVTPWDNCLYSAEEERDFVKVLGPLFNEKGLDAIKIIVWDHNKDIMKERVDVMFADAEAAKWVWGVGFHWYSHSDQDNVLDNSILDYTYEKYQTNLVFTEGCNPLGDHDSFVGKWWTGEKYALNIINDLNHWTTAWCEWNLYLDEKGGPNHVANYCDAPIIVDTQKQKLHFNSPYYYIAHFSKYIKPGAVRLDSTVNKDLQVTAFQNEDGSAAVVVINMSENDVSFDLEIAGDVSVNNIEKRSIQTYLI